MKTYKQLVNELPVGEDCHVLTEEELHHLHVVLFNAYKDIEAVCNKYNISVAMTGGNAIGAIRHKGFIPWDDDADLIMTRADYEIFKGCFQKELGDRYILNAPNLSQKPTNRFPKILIKGTRFVEMSADDDDRACIKLDLFILENIPENKLLQLLKGTYCNVLMVIAGVVNAYEHRSPAEERRMSATKAGKRAYRARLFLGRMFSFRKSYRWFDSVDKHCQYSRGSSLTGTPTGTNHYFGMVMDRSVVLPFRKVPFEDTTVYIPNDYDAYLTQLFGDYMTVPPVEKREHHYVREIAFTEH